MNTPSFAAASALLGLSFAVPARAQVAQPDPIAPQVTPASEAFLTLRRIGSVIQPGAEIPAYDAAGRRAYIAGGAFAAEIDLRRPGYPGWVRQFDLSEAAGLPSFSEDPKNVGTVTHIVVDPAGRNFAAATVCPHQPASREGSVVLFHMPTGVILKSLKVGFEPDALVITPDGQKLIAANEGSPAFGPDGEVIDPPGGISIIDLSGLPDAESIVRQLNQDRVRTITLDGPIVDEALARPASNPQHIRIHPAAKDKPALDLEPESLALLGDRLFITLQENNAIAEFDLAAGAWKRLAGLGAIEQTIDASDFDGGIKIAQKVRGLPMPDQVIAFTLNGRACLATANEGDNRGEANDRAAPRGDRARLRDLARWNKLSTTLMSTADLSDPVTGRLWVSTIDGDEDGDGRIDVPIMFGTRSLSVWDADTLKLIGDTGPAFEQLSAERAKEQFNAERIGAEEPPVFQFDARSPESGPEPEGLAFAQVAGRPVAFVTLERPGAIVAVDLSDPAHPRAFEFAAAARDGDIAPEGIAYVPGEQSASSEPMLIVCSENTGAVSVYRIITH